MLAIRPESQHGNCCPYCKHPPLPIKIQRDSGKNVKKERNWCCNWESHFFLQLNVEILNIISLSGKVKLLEITEVIFENLQYPSCTIPNRSPAQH